MPAAPVHPLEQRDRLIVDRLLAAASPSEADLIDCARLLLRYQGFPGAASLQADLAAARQRWGFDAAGLHAATRALWARGYRPAGDSGEPEVGSGADVGAG